MEPVAYSNQNFISLRGVCPHRINGLHYATSSQRWQRLDRGYTTSTIRRHWIFFWIKRTSSIVIRRATLVPGPSQLEILQSSYCISYVSQGYVLRQNRKKIKQKRTTAHFEWASGAIEASCEQRAAKLCLRATATAG